MWGPQPCALCGKGQEAASLGPLLGPVADKGGGLGEVYVHRLCALWSPEVFQTEQGTLRQVGAAVRRGRQVRCGHCGRRGATLGCRLERCPCSYHLACALEAGATFYCSEYAVACPDHAPAYPQRPEDRGLTPFAPQRAAGGSAQATPGGPGWTPGAPGASPEALASTPGLVSPPTALPMPRQRGLNKRGRRAAEDAYQHMMAARAALKRARREIRAARRRSAESSDDDEHFAKKEAARLARDKARLAPITLGGEAGPGGSAAVQQLPPGAPGAPAAPPPAPTVITGTDFSSVAGLDSVVAQLREMVLLPLMYPALFQRMGITPPRGILLHGEPGTGKTLAARALAGACAKHSPTPVTFFARKGADCLGKFSGEAERTLRLLFEEASARAPSIVFLDELDALVPARAARAGGSDQIYASVVSTLLSLMDGVSDRGNVVVIGATNRPEAIDPALRRPGRFDREVYFGLPGPEQRAAILQVHTRRWPSPPPAELLQQVAGLAEGYAGADLQALCTAAVMAAVRRTAPTLLSMSERASAGTAAPEAPKDSGTAAAAPAGGASGAGLAAGQQQQQQQQQQEQEQQQGGRAAELVRVLEAVVVEPRDWWEALAAAPAPCSRRHGLSALSAGAARPLPPHLLPLLAPALRQALRVLHSSALPLPPAAGTAAAAAAAPDMPAGSAPTDLAGPSSGTAGTSPFADLLRQLGAALPLTCSSSRSSSSSNSSWHWQLGPLATKDSAVPAATAAAAAEAAAVPLAEGPQPCSAGLELQRPASAPGAGGSRLGASCWVPCRLLLAGEGERGQEQGAGAVLKLLEGCPVHTISLPTAIVDGGGDATGGIVSMVSEALRRAGPSAPCIFFLPRLEAWALSQMVIPREELEAAEEGQAGATAAAGAEATPHRPSFAAAAAALLRQAAASPSLGGHGTPRSAGRRFPTAPSPFSGLLPLEERTPATPSAAHALRAEAESVHRHASTGHLLHPEPPSGAGAQLPSIGKQALAPPPPRAAPAGAAAAAQAVLEGALEAAGRLPRIRTSLSPDKQEADGSAAAAHPRPSRLSCTPGRQPPPPGQREGEGEAVEEVEVTRLAEPWNVFESLIKQAPPSQPILVLATTHAPLDSLPPLLLSFFGAAAAGEAAGTAARAATPSSSGGLVVVAPPGEAAWGQGLAAAAEGAAESIAAHAAAALQARLEEAARAGEGLAAAAEATAAGPPAASGRQPGGAAACTATAAAPAADAAPADAAAPGAEALSAQHAAAVAAAVPLPPGVSRAEMDRGGLLLGKVSAFIKHLGARLGSDPRCHLASAWVRPPRPPRRAGGGGSGHQRQDPAAHPQHHARGGHPAGVLVSFEDVARRAKRGGYATLDALQADANRTARAILAAPGGDRHDPAAAACCALLDDIESRCHTLRQQLGLDEGDAAALLAAAAQHVAAVERALQARPEVQQHAEQQPAQAKAVCAARAGGGVEPLQQQPASTADAANKEAEPQAAAERAAAPADQRFAAQGQVLALEQAAAAAHGGSGSEEPPPPEHAAAGLRALLRHALPPAVADALRRQAKQGPLTLASLEEVLALVEAAGCSACSLAVEAAPLGPGPGEAELRMLAAQCVAAVRQAA